MNSVDSQWASAVRSRPPAAALRIHGGKLIGSIVEIPEGRTIVGSGPRSAVRLEESGVEPVHCLIDLQAGRLSVRSWAASTFLNGEPFDEARLSPGDILSVGPIDLEMVDPPGDHSVTPWMPLPEEGEDPPSTNHEDDAAPPTSAPGDQDSDVSPAEVMGSEEAETLGGKRPDLLSQSPNCDGETARDDVHQRPALDQWNWLVQENARLSSDVEQLVDSQSRVISELSALASELGSLQSQWSEWWQSEAAQWQTQLAEHCQRVGELENQLAAVREVVAAELERVAAQSPPDREERAAPAAETASADDLPLEPPELGAREAETGYPPGDGALRDDESEGQPESGADANDAIAPLRELSIRKQKVPDADPAGEDRSAKEQAADEDDSIADAAANATEEVAREPSGSTHSPISYLDRYAGMFSDDDVGEDAASTVPAAASGPDDRLPPSVEDGRPIAQTPAGARDDEESIEAYMAKLLQRVRGASAGLAPETAASPENHPPDPSRRCEHPPVNSPDAPPADAPAKANDLTRDDAGDVRPKCWPPERPTDIEVLRALANETARRAIRVHATSTHQRKTVTKFIVAMLAGTTSLWLMLDAPSPRDLQFIAACVSLMAAAYWAGQTCGTLVESIRARRYDGPVYDELDDEDPIHPPLPIDVELRR